VSSVSRAPSPVLSWPLPAQIAILIAALLGPLAVGFGAAQPLLFGDFSDLAGSPWVAAVAGVMAAGLFIIPVIWTLASRKMDLLALTLAQNGLIIAGYFFLNVTAYNLQNQGTGILNAAPLVVFINAAGFALFLLSLGATYLLAVLSRARLAPLVDQPENYDRRLRKLLIATGFLAGAVITLPMAASGTIPMLAADPVAARFDMIKSDVARALYHMGTALLPFVVGGLLAGIMRRPALLFRIDGALVMGIVVAQILTSNRLPLAITLIVTTTLLSMERRWPRILLLAAFAGYIVLFTGLSGFTSILRQDRSALEDGNIVRQSVSEAFLGDNLIDLRDASWVFSHWNHDPLMGKTYLGGLVAMVPSGIFPQKKEWHLGLTGVRIVGWNPEHHFGLRITFFGEAFLNFGWIGVAAIALILGSIFGVLLRMLHLAGSKSPPCLAKNLKIAILMQMTFPLANTSDAFTSWSMLVLLTVMWLWVDLPLQMSRRIRARTALVAQHG
jgi:oligosaccharide repeat unit polymerase